MKKQVFGRQLKRDANERKALFKNLLTSLVLNERIKTTEAKAKAIKSKADKLITKAKKGGDLAYKNIHPEVNGDAAVKLVKDLGPRFAKRQGGYTRILKLGKHRVSDNAKMVIIEWTENSTKQNNLEQKTKNKKQAKQQSNVKQVKSLKKEAAVKKAEAKPVSIKEKPKTGGFLKQLVTRQKKG